jgi:hypothetical protein
LRKEAEKGCSLFMSVRPRTVMRYGLALIAALLLTISVLLVVIQSPAATPLAIRYAPPTDLPSNQVLSWAESHVFFFLHVPKTAGQAFATTLRNAVAPYQLLRNRSQKSSPRFDLTFMRTKRAVALGAPANHTSFERSYGQSSLVVGHTDVHVRELFRSSGRQVELLTMVRDPVERVYSHYCYIFSLPNVNMHHETFPSWIESLHAPRVTKPRDYFTKHLISPPP